jgi:non-reducing end alpha-L-arabinofuranosidase
MKRASIRLALASLAGGATVIACGSFSTGANSSASSSGTGASSSSNSSGATSGTGSDTTQTGGNPNSNDGSTGTLSASGTPCDILGSAGTPCVAAHSTVRVIYGGYTGPLYQVCKGAYVAGPNSCTSGTTLDIGSVNGIADSASQDAFCPSPNCTISIIYDQTPNHNDLQPAPPGGNKATPDNPADPTALKISISGHQAYGVLITLGHGYRAGCANCAVKTATGTATGDQPETEYMVTSSNKTQGGCCFDYGNAETDSHDDGAGTMEALHFGDGVVWGTGSPGGHQNGVNSWVMADLENGIFAGWELRAGSYTDQSISTNMPLNGMNFVTGVLVGDVQAQNGGMGRFALYGGDATSGILRTEYDGIRPSKAGYNPMAKQGSIILGTGGDNSNGGGGEFFEGVMATGAASLEAVNALQANIVAAGYGR